MKLKDWYFDGKGYEREQACIKALQRFYDEGEIIVTRGTGKTLEELFGLPYTSSGAYAAKWNCQANAHYKNNPNMLFECVAIDENNCIVAQFSNKTDDMAEWTDIVIGNDEFWMNEPHWTDDVQETSFGVVTVESLAKANLSLDLVIRRLESLGFLVEPNEDANSVPSLLYSSLTEIQNAMFAMLDVIPTDDVTSGYYTCQIENTDELDEKAKALVDFLKTQDTSAELKRLYNGHKNICCKCGCSLSSAPDIPLGSVFVLDRQGRFYCMDCDGDFEDGDERIYDIELDD